MSEFIEEWNTVMTYKIRDSDLQRPTETFLTKTLSSLLTAMQIKDSYTLKMQNENKVESQIAKATFQKYIDGLYKIADGKNSFMYIDLIQPTPKKTSHLLRILLNYYFFYKMMKENLLSRVSPKLSARDNLMKTNNALKIEIEKLKMQKEMMEKKFNDLKRELPQLQNEQQRLKAEIDKNMKESKAIKAGLEEVNGKIKEANHKIESLESENIDEDQAHQLIASKEKYVQEQQDLKERHTAINIRLLDTLNKKQELEALFTKIDELCEYLDTKDAIEIQLKHSNIQKELIEVEHSIENMKTDFNKVKKEHAVATKQILQINTKNKKKLKGKKREKTIVQKENREKESESIELQQELKIAEKKMEEAKDELESIIVEGQEILQYIISG